MRTRVTQVGHLMLQVVKAPLHFVLANGRLVQSLPQLTFGHFSPLMVLFQLGHPTAEEIVDDLEFADAGLEGGVQLLQRFIRGRRLEMAVIERRGGTRRRMSEMQSR